MTFNQPPLRPARMPLHKKILIGLVVGVLAGLVGNRVGARLAVRPSAQEPATAQPDASWIWLDADRNTIADGVDALAQNVADPLGRVFLRLIFMVVLPLVISALALGVIGMGEARRLGRVGLRTLVLTLVLSGGAVGLGMTLVNVFRPGAALSQEQQQFLRTQYAERAAQTVAEAQRAKSLPRILLDIIPENPLQEMVGAVDGSSKGNGMLAVMFFALVLGAAITAAPAEKTRTLIRLLEGMFEVSMVVIQFAMRLAPYAVACLVFSVTARLGFTILQTLFWFILTVMTGLSLQLFVVYSVLVRTVGGMSPRQFFSGIKEAMFTAFGTSSSNATLPTALRVAQENLRLPKDISHFVLTIGATGNQNGTALYEGVVVLFLAQVFGIELTLAQQMMVMFMAILAGVGTAGVPGGSLPMIVIVLQAVSVPGEAIALIFGIDRILDMCRTVLNVTGDLALATCVSRWERGRAATAADVEVRQIET